MHTKEEFNQFKRLISKRSTTIILGAGASKAINPKSPSWNEAVLQALKVARNLYLRDEKLNSKYSELVYLLKSDNSQILQVADQVAEVLHAPHSYPWRIFLSKTFGRMRPINRDFALIIREFGGRIVTTNYDTLIEKALKMRPALLSDKKILDMLDHDRSRVFHIHGIYNKPESILWTSSDYSNRLGNLIDIHIQNRISERGIVMIGCGGTLDDPNFQQWRNFINQASRFGGAYRLHCESELVEPSAGHIDICYGQNYSDLVPFLVNVLPKKSRIKFSSKIIRRNPKSTNRKQIEPVTKRIGPPTARDAELIELTAEIVANYVANNPFSVEDLPGLIRETYNALKGDPENDEETQ